MAEKTGWDQSQLRKYDIPLDEIPRLNVRDPRVDEFIAENVSVLMKQAVI
jgi:hypoxia-inducible factor 1-alpha inhibitor (HIF hydroxylase)